MRRDIGPAAAAAAGQKLIDKFWALCCFSSGDKSSKIISSTNFLMFRPCTSLLFHIPALYTCGTYFLQQNICFLIVGDLHYYSVLLSVVIKRMLPRRSGEAERGLEEGDASSDRDLGGDEEAWCWTLCCWAAVPESRESKSIAGTPATHHSSRPLYSRCPPSQHPNTNTNSETYTITNTKTHKQKHP